MVQFDSDALMIEEGVMFGRVTIDGDEVRAGITLPAFDQLIQRAGFDPDRDLGQVMVRDILALLRPTIEAYLQTKHFVGTAPGQSLIIDLEDLVTH